MEISTSEHSLKRFFKCTTLGVRGVENLQVNRNATCNINIPYYNVLQNAMGGNFNLLSVNQIDGNHTIKPTDRVLNFFKFFILYIYILLCFCKIKRAVLYISNFQTQGSDEFLKR